MTERSMTEPEGPFVSLYAAFADRCAMWGARFAGLALVLICVLVVAEILSRNILNRSTMIADEMCGYLNVATVFLGLAYTMQQGGFIRMEILYKTLHGTAKLIANWINVLLSLAYASIVLYYMIIYTLYSYNNNIISAEITETPQYIPQLFLVIGALLLVIYLMKFVVTRCRDVP